MWVLQGDVKSLGLSPLEQAEEADPLSELTDAVKMSSVSSGTYGDISSKPLPEIPAG